MNFQYISPVPRAKDLLDIAFSRARERSIKKYTGTPEERQKQKQHLKFEIIVDTIISRIEKIRRDFPYETALSPFYTKLFHLTLDMPLFKRSMAAMRWAIPQIIKLKKQKLSLQAFYGRTSSICKQIDRNLEYLETCRKTLKTYPDIKDIPTVILYGFPNVGKSTLLNKLTESKAKIASYPFTTKRINVGYFIHKDHKIQVIDVPGTLNRTKHNKIELQAELVLIEVADVVVYVYDFTEFCGYTLEKQHQLAEKLDNPIIYCSKTDILQKKPTKIGRAS